MTQLPEWSNNWPVVQVPGSNGMRIISCKMPSGKGEECGWEWQLQLLDALWQTVGPDQGIENCKDVAAVFHHASKNIAQIGVAVGFFVPFQQYGGRDFDVAAQLFGGMATKEKAIEESGFALREVEIGDDLRWNELRQGSHKENAVYRKNGRGQVELAVPCGYLGNSFPSSSGKQQK
ncbi:MAG: hypothetical protein NVS9B4_10060 [Candidatus Acidiferrum sp.]